MASRKILIVDDEVDVLSTLTAGLERWGFGVDAYNNPLAALSNFKPKLYEVAILDFRMPQMNGFDMYRQLKKIDPNLRVCFLTAGEIYDVAYSDIISSIPANCIIQKPVTNEELLTRINTIIDDSGSSKVLT